MHACFSSLSFISPSVLLDIKAKKTFDIISQLAANVLSLASRRKNMRRFRPEKAHQLAIKVVHGLSTSWPFSKTFFFTAVAWHQRHDIWLTWKYNHIRVSMVVADGLAAGHLQPWWWPIPVGVYGISHTMNMQRMLRLISHLCYRQWLVPCIGYKTSYISFQS